MRVVRVMRVCDVLSVFLFGRCCLVVVLRSLFFGRCSLVVVLRSFMCDVC